MPITLAVGTSGGRVCGNFWTLLDSRNSNWFFAHTKKPKAVFVDCAPTPQCPVVFDERLMLSHGKGSETLIKRTVDLVTRLVRLEGEDAVADLVAIHPITSVSAVEILVHIRDFFGSKIRITNIVIIPFSPADGPLVGSDAIRSLAALVDVTDGIVMFANSSLLPVLHEFENINDYIARCVSQLVASEEGLQLLHSTLFRHHRHRIALVHSGIETRIPTKGLIGALVVKPRTQFQADPFAHEYKEARIVTIESTNSVAFQLVNSAASVIDTFQPFLEAASTVDSARIACEKIRIDIFLPYLNL